MVVKKRRMKRRSKRVIASSTRMTLAGLSLEGNRPCYSAAEGSTSRRLKPRLDAWVGIGIEAAAGLPLGGCLVIGFGWWGRRKQAPAIDRATPSERLLWRGPCKRQTPELVRLRYQGAPTMVRPSRFLQAGRPRMLTVQLLP